MSVLERLHALARTFARRRAAALVLAALAGVGGIASLAALLARAGLLAHARWLPLALWFLLLAGLVWFGRALRRLTATPDAHAMRETAAVVEGERSLRRGTLVGLVDLAAGPGPGASAALAEGAARRAAQRLPEPDPAAWAPARTAALAHQVRRRAVLAAGAALVTGLSFWYAGDAAAALVSPLRALRAAVRPRVVIALSRSAVTPGDSAVVTVETEAGAADPTLYVRRTGEAWRPVRLAADAAGRARHVLNDIRAETFVFAASDGRASDTLGVRILMPLMLGDFGVTAVYPAYLRRGDEELDPAGGPLALPVGTVLSLRGVTSAPLGAARLTAGADTVPLRPTAAGFTGRLVVRGTARWKLALADRAGAELPEPVPTLDVRAIPDSAPVVTVPVPGADTTVPLDLRTAIVVDLRDDHGLARAEVVSWRVSRLGVVGDTVVDTIPGVHGADRLVLSQPLDLRERGLNPGDTVRYFVRALDAAPLPHVGRSREFAFRLRTIAEMRDAVREGTDSLAREAAQLAADQHEVSRQTEDLAAQRNRTADRTPRPTETPRGAAERADENGTQQFEQNAQAQQVADEQQALLARADSLRQELERVMEAAEQAGLNDPSWREQLRHLDELLRDATSPELQRQLEALQRALQQLDPRGVQDALRNLARRQQELRDQLQRSAELFERAAIEGAMQTFAANAEQLERQQRAWADRAPDRADSGAAAADQRDLAQQTDSLRQNVQRLEQRLDQRGDSAGRQAMSDVGQQLDGAQQTMQQAARSMQAGQRTDAARHGTSAAQQLQQTAQSLRQTQQQMSNSWREEVLRMLDQSTQETVALANEEQRLGRELRRGAGARDARGRQAAMEQGIGQILRRLQDAAGRNALVSPRLGAMMNAARDQISQSRQALEGPSPNPSESADRAQDAAQMLSAAAVQMLRNASDVSGAQSGSGYQEAMQRMAQLAGQQGQLNDELGGLMPMLGQGQDAIMQQLRALAARQRSLANQVERLNESGVPGNPQQLANEARQLADRIEQARLDRATLERQQRLFRRMLDAGRTLRNDDQPEDPERRSHTAEAGTPFAPTTTARPGTLRYPPPSWEQLRQLSPSERVLVLDYFRRLNAPAEGGGAPQR